MSSDVPKKILDLTKKAIQSLHNSSFSIALAQLKEAETLVSPSYIPRYLKTQTYFGLARYYQVIGHLQKSLKYLQKVLDITQDKASLAKSHLNIAFILSTQGLHQKSLFHNFKALDLLSNSEEYEGLASAYHSLGLEYQHLTQNAKAVKAFKEGLLISKNHLGVNHKLTKILRTCYLDSHKDMVRLKIKAHNYTQSDHHEINRIVQELETPPLKTFTPLPKYLKTKKKSMTPLKTPILTRSIQCGSSHLTNETPTKSMSKSPILIGQSIRIRKHAKSVDPGQGLLPVPAKNKIVISGKHFFTMDSQNHCENAAVIIQKNIKTWVAAKKYKSILKSALIIQKNWRMAINRKKFAQMKKSAVKIQASFRGFRERKFYQFFL